MSSITALTPAQIAKLESTQFVIQDLSKQGDLGLTGATAINLGTGHGYSVKDMINSVSSIVGRAIPHVIGARRPGDISTCYADPSLAQRLLGWRATRDLTRMCADSWRWQSGNPNGYAQGG